MQASTEMEMKALPITAGFIFIFNKIDLDQFEITARGCKAVLLDTSFVFVSDLGSKRKIASVFPVAQSSSRGVKIRNPTCLICQKTHERSNQFWEELL